MCYDRRTVNTVTRSLFTLAAALVLAMPLAASADAPPWIGERPQDLRIALSSSATAAITNTDGDLVRRTIAHQNTL